MAQVLLCMTVVAIAIASTSAMFLPSTIHDASFLAADPINSRCANFSVRFHAKPDLTKLSGTWYNVAATIPGAPSDSSAVQANISQGLGCSKQRLDLHDVQNFNVTNDVVFRQPISDKTILPPGAVVIGNNEIRYSYQARPANSSHVNDGHWVLEIPTNNGTIVADYMTIATDYNTYSIWFACGSAPGNSSVQIEQWGILSRFPKTLGKIQKFVFKTIAKQAGVSPAWSDHLFDYQQDMCF